jgi:hypothetical protein
MRATRNLTQPMYGGVACGASAKDVPCPFNPCPTDCVLSNWTEWTACGKTCSSVDLYGSMERTRTIISSPIAGGQLCPALEESKECGTAVCPIDCVVSSFQDWQGCPVTCGTGLQVRVRETVREEENGGKACPSLMETRGCVGLPACPVPCEISAWGAWSTCDRTCGSGDSTRTRTILTAAAGDISEKDSCPVLQQHKFCNTATCAVDCEMGAWDTWGDCSQTCNGGTRQRHRSENTPALYGGVACPTAKETGTCGEGACPVDCAVSAWEEFATCSVSCGAGWRLRRRNIVKWPASGGKACPGLDEQAPCDLGECPHHCTVSTFSDWSACSTTCGAGSMTRVRSITEHASHSGYECPNLEDTAACNTANPCPQDCTVGDWSSWGTCDKSCGGGFQTRVRVVATAAVGTTGKACPNLSHVQECSPHSCPVDCAYSPWALWTHCSQTCGTGSSTRSRSITTEASNGGVACQAIIQTEECGTKMCPADCVHSTWNQWSQCTAECGGGSQTRSRAIIHEAAHGGVACGATHGERVCNEEPCADRCDVSDWGTYGACSASCGTGAQTRVRMIVATHGQNFQCPWLSETRPCERQACPTDCIVTDWTLYETCSKTCGGGSQQSTRQVTRGASTGGAKCPELVQTKTCNTEVCAVDCAVTIFNPWTACDVSCGNGTQTRQRLITRDPIDGGVACPALTEERRCNTESCPIDCVQEAWGNWSTCSVSCGWGNKARSRATLVQPGNGGIDCEDNHQTQACEDAECPADCEMSAWGGWTDCTKSCGSGSQQRSRKLLEQAQGAGKCAALSETRECNDQTCPYDCKVTNFLTWGDCDSSCGGGTRTKRRSIVSPATFGGKECPSLDAVEQCHEHLCPVDCTWGSWTDWTLCSSTCGADGHETRQRVAQKQPSHGGKACANSQDQRTCNAGPCPVHCVMSDWSNFDECSKSCAGGHKSRTRTVVSHAQNGGFQCGSTVDERNCNSHDCPIDCVVTGWSAWSLCNAKCGSGDKARSRVVVTERQAGGVICPALSQKETCDSGPCAHNVKVSDWSEWGTCSQSCAGGQMTRTRTVTLRGADFVEPILTQTKECNVSPCPVNCTVGDWQSWGSCDATCGTLAHNGVKTRAREIVHSSSFQGTVCPHLTDSMECGTIPCPVDCKVSAFTAWSACDKTCGGGNQRRTRHPTGFVTAFGGKECPDLTEHQACDEQACPSDCEVDQWGPYGDCSLSCGGGVRVQERIITKPMVGGGKACPATIRNHACPTNPCPVHCTVGDWGGYGDCDATCGGGESTRTRAVISHAKHGGYVCESTTSSVSCANTPCAIDCHVTQFSDWSACAQSCGTGFQYREREVVHSADQGGKACPALQMARDCNSEECPVDCVLGAWSSYTECSKTCGTDQGHRERSREILSGAKFGGAACASQVSWENCEGYQECPEEAGCTLGQWGQWSTCPKACYGLDGEKGSQTRSRTVAPQTDSCAAYGSQDRECAIPACSIDCETGEWSSWTVCTKSCDGGMKYRFREPLAGKEGNEYGAKCTDLTDYEVCNSGACPTDCAMSELSEWSECDKTCGAGERTATRTTITPASYGGKSCSAPNVTEICNAQICPVDCAVTAWSGWSTCVSAPGGQCEKAQFRRVDPFSVRGSGKPCPKDLNRWAPCKADEPGYCPTPAQLTADPHSCVSTGTCCSHLKW